MFEIIKGLFKPKPAIELKIEEVCDFIYSELDLDLRPAREKINAMISDASGNLDEMKRLLLELKEKQSEDVFANSVKNKFCEKAVGLIESIETPEASYKPLINYLKSKKALTNGVSNIEFKEMVHLRAFKEQMDNIAARTKLLIDRDKKLENLINSTDLEKIDKIENKLNAFKAMLDSKNELEKELKKAETDIIDSEAAAGEKKAELEELLKDDRFQKLDALKNEAEELERNRAMTKQKIATEFSGLDKALKKFQHSGFASRDEDALINNYIADSDAFLLDEKLEIKGVLEKLRQKMGNNELEIEEKKNERILYLLDNFNSMTELRDNYKKLEEEIAEKNRHREGLMPVIDEKLSKENELQEAEKKLTWFSEKKERLLSEIERKKKQIEAGINEIEGMVGSLLKRKVAVRV